MNFLKIRQKKDQQNFVRNWSKKVAKKCVKSSKRSLNSLSKIRQNNRQKIVNTIDTINNSDTKELRCGKQTNTNLIS